MSSIYHKPPDYFLESLFFPPNSPDPRVPHRTHLGIFSAAKRQDEKQSQRGGEGQDKCIHLAANRDQVCRLHSHREPALPALRAAVVRVVCLVVHHQLIVHKVKAVGLRLVRVQDHLPYCEEARNTK